MTTIPGASQYLSASRYSSATGEAVQSSSLADVMGTSLLSVGRRLSTTGFGLSDTARALTEQQLSSSAASINGLFSATVSGTSTIENLQTQIQGLRSKYSYMVDADAVAAFEDDGSVSASDTGTIVDEEA